MALQIKQFRYYGKNNPLNYPSWLNLPSADQGDDGSDFKLKKGTAFNEFTPIVQLGIQGLPGTQFGVNRNDDLITIGNTGVYELDLNAQVSIEKLIFTQDSLTAIDKSETACLIIDILYGLEE